MGEDAKSITSSLTNPKFLHDKVVVYFGVTDPDDKSSYEEYDELRPDQKQFYELISQDIAAEKQIVLDQLTLAENDINVLHEFAHDLLEMLDMNDVRGAHENHTMLLTILENIGTRRRAWEGRQV
jgi:hypothetical protein